MRHLKGLSVTIVGAGIAGLAAASALALRGAHVHVYEQARSLEPVGAGLQISPNGRAVLDALQVETAAVESRAVELCDHAAGRRVLRLDLTGPRYGRPFSLVHRADVILALERRARDLGVGFSFGTHLDAARADGDLVIGADGVRSTLRPALNGAVPAFFTGQVAWRAVVPGDAAPEARVYMGPGRHLVTYPLVGGRRNVVAVEERADWVEEDWDLADDPANLRHAFRAFAPAVQTLLKDIEQVKIWGLFRHDVAKTWQDGHRVLIGDAAHPTLPFLAQGANLALEDALILARCLDANSQGDALKQFEALRRPRVSRAIRAANANAKSYHIAHPVLRRVAHTGLRVIDRVAPDLMLRRFDWLYGFDPSA